MTIEKITEFISAEKIASRIKEVAKQITKDYKDKDILILAVLKGSIVFMTDLIKEIDSNRLSIDFIGLSSYKGGTHSTGKINITKEFDKDLSSKHVIILEDIVDTGLTIDFLIKKLKTQKPKSIAVCTLLEKPSNLKIPVPIDYKCFVIPDKFVIGYGLDYQERYRNLPYVGVMEFID